MFVSMFKFHFSLHAVAVKLLLTLVFMSTHLIFISYPKSFGIPFMFGLIVPQYCIVLLHHLPNNPGDNENFVHV